MMKAQFLQQWDGLATDHGRCVVVMGATNRPQDVDRAILRRMPAAFHIPLPVSHLDLYLFMGSSDCNNFLPFIVFLPSYDLDFQDGSVKTFFFFIYEPVHCMTFSPIL